ncbi:MAG: SMI1/KNR4 family protein [Candidatus Limnocylindrales bacterium]
MTIESLIGFLQETWSSPRLPDPDGAPDSGLLICRFPSAAVWDRAAIEAATRVTLPEDLVTLWSLADGVTLFEDVEYGQWGLVIWSPKEVVRPDGMLTDLYLDKMEAGDLAIGRFIGDLDLILLRCDPAAPDFGAVVIAIDDYGRSDWFRPAGSLGDFLERFARTPEAKYWET